MSDEAPFEQLVAHAAVLDLEHERTFEKITEQASTLLAEKLSMPAARLKAGFLEGSRYGATPVARGIALPHQRIAGIDRTHLVMVRCRAGLHMPFDAADVGVHDATDPVYAIFFLVSPEDNPGHHLRVLANLAGRIDEEQFMAHWRGARSEQELKEALLRHDRYLSLTLTPEDATAELIGRAIKDLNLPPGNLIALIHRDGQIIVPGGSSRLAAGDRITIIGAPDGIRKLYERYRA